MKHHNDYTSADGDNDTNVYSGNMDRMSQPPTTGPLPLNMYQCYNDNNSNNYDLTLMPISFMYTKNRLEGDFNPPPILKVFGLRYKPNGNFDLPNHI